MKLSLIAMVMFIEKESARGIIFSFKFLALAFCRVVSTLANQRFGAGSSLVISLSKMEVKLPTSHLPQTLHEREPCTEFDLF